MSLESRSFPGDAAHENGNYNCSCIKCGELFIGHKRRVVCRSCEDEAQRWWHSLSPEEYAAAKDRQAAAIREWFERNS